VAAYFEDRYHLKLKLPGAPCLNVGTTKRQNWLPSEVGT